MQVCAGVGISAYVLAIRIPSGTRMRRFFVCAFFFFNTFEKQQPQQIVHFVLTEFYIVLNLCTYKLTPFEAKRHVAIPLKYAVDSAVVIRWFAKCFLFI